MQNQQEDSLLERLREVVRTSRHATGEQTWQPQRRYPPATGEELAHAAAQLGFALPSLLRRIYLEVGNGGFGPGYGLLPLYAASSDRAYGMESLVAAYQTMRAFSQQDIDKYFAEEEEEEVKPALWPAQVLILCDWGCNIYSCLDCSSSNCSSSDKPILRMDNNENFMVEWAIEAPSLQAWLVSWLDRPPALMNWAQARKVPVSQLGRAI